jgi:phosphonate transport system substrate-binding protein
LSFRTAKNIPEFEKQLAAGNYDFSYINPYYYTVFSQNPGYRAFGRQADKRIRGIMVVRKDNPIKSLKDLFGSTIAFPTPPLSPLACCNAPNCRIVDMSLLAEHFH